MTASSVIRAVVAGVAATRDRVAVVDVAGVVAAVAVATTMATIVVLASGTIAKNAASVRRRVKSRASLSRAAKSRAASSQNL